MGGFVCFVALATATLCACSSLPQALAVSLQWMQTEPNGPFIARDQASAALIDGGQAALLIGGSDAAANALADVWRFHPNGTVRRLRRRALCAGRGWAASVQHGSRTTLRVCICADDSHRVFVSDPCTAPVVVVAARAGKR